MGLATVGGHYYSQPEEVRGKGVLPVGLPDRSGGLQWRGMVSPDNLTLFPPPVPPIGGIPLEDPGVALT